MVDRNYRTLNDGQVLRQKIQRDIVTHIPRGATRVLKSSFEPMTSQLIVEDDTAMTL